MNVSATTTPLTDVINWNQSPGSTPTQTSIQTAQQTLAQVPQQVLAPFTSAYTSLYGAAAVDSLLGNISTSAGLNALSQLNASRPASKQISPFSTTANAVAYGEDGKTSALETLFSDGTDNSSPMARVIAAYYPASSSSDSADGPQLDVTA